MKKETFKLDKKVIWIGSGLAVTLAGFGIWYLMKKRKEKQQITEKIKKTTTSGSSPGIRSFSCRHPDSSFPLQFGTCGNKVKKLQSYLNSKGGSLTVDGKFGPKTEAAVQKTLGAKTVSEVKFNALG